MNDWLDVMLDEIARKKREAREAEDEQRLRTGQEDDARAESVGQSRSEVQSQPEAQSK